MDSTVDTRTNLLASVSNPRRKRRNSSPLHAPSEALSRPQMTWVIDVEAVQREEDMIHTERMSEVRPHSLSSSLLTVQ